MDKKQLIQQIESLRQSRIITYLTSDRVGPVNARIAMDVIPVISKQLHIIGKTQNIDLFLYSSGGDTMVPWRLVSMIREYCDKFSVLIPYKAHSAATMIALGADEIVMSDLSEISPIDPSTANVFNPNEPQNPQSKIPISVEDVMAYFELAKNKFGIKNDEDLAKIFNKFVESNPQIHPLALGNVNRIHNLIRILAKRLLKSHKSPMRDEEIEKVVDYFTEKLYSHQYFIGRKEAKEDLGVKTVVNADETFSKAMTDLYEEYKKEMELDILWNPENELGLNAMQNRKPYKIAFIDSRELFSNFELTIDYKKQQVNIVQQTPQGPIQIPEEQVGFKVVGQGWK
jgi:sporulation protein YlmC with PRC-barrel domain